MSEPQGSQFYVIQESYLYVLLISLNKEESPQFKNLTQKPYLL